MAEEKVTSFIEKIGTKKDSLIVVGSGITGLMTAWEANKAGYDVTVISQSPDPRIKSANDNPNFSSTFDGQDQRYITLFEGHPYLNLVGYVEKMYPDIAGDFMKEVMKGGMLAWPFEKFSERSRKWLLERAAVNKELETNPDLQKKVKDLFTEYAEENRAAMVKWYGFIGELLEKDPSLATKISLSYEGIMRLYDGPVIDAAEKSHREGGVFKEKYSPEELKEKFPAYAAGVDNGFIKGGSLEMYGLTLGVKTIGEAMMDIMEKKEGVKFIFDKKVLGAEKNERGQITGLRVEGQEERVTAKHYMIHAGSYGLEGLYKDAVPEAKDDLAAVTGLWITIDNAETIVEQMGGKPNKVHGKQSLEALLDRINPDSKVKFSKMFSDLGVTDFAGIAPIVDFNIMPITSPEGKVTLGIGSGYIFEGLAEPDLSAPSGREMPKFQSNKKAEDFVLVLMQVWLEALYGEQLLATGEMKIIDRGCRRSWSVNDKERFDNIPTVEGGVLGIRGGGNTGSTTKAGVEAPVNIAILDAIKRGAISEEDLKDLLVLAAKTGKIKDDARLKAGDVDFKALTDVLGKKVLAAKRLAAVSGRSGRQETKSGSQAQGGSG